MGKYSTAKLLPIGQLYEIIDAMYEAYDTNTQYFHHNRLINSMRFVEANLDDTTNSTDKRKNTRRLG
jgi:hypothetical protein